MDAAIAQSFADLHHSVRALEEAVEEEEKRGRGEEEEEEGEEEEKEEGGTRKEVSNIVRQPRAFASYVWQGSLVDPRTSARVCMRLLRASPAPFRNGDHVDFFDSIAQAVRTDP